MSVQVQGCGEAGLYTLQVTGASYIATHTEVQGADVTHSISLLSIFALRAYKDSNMCNCTLAISIL